MKKNKNNKRSEVKNRKVFWVFLIFCAAVVGTTAFLMMRQDLEKGKKQIAENQADKEIAERIKKEAEEKENANVEKNTEKTTQTEDEPKKQVQFENPDPAPKNIVGYVSFKDFSDSQLTIIAVIRQRLNTQGTCTLSLNSMDGKKVENIIVKTGNDPSTSHCQTFKVPREKLAAGKWKISIKIVAGEQTGTIEDEVIL